MISPVEICNLALLKIKKRIISSLGESSESGRTCNMVYDQARQEVLGAYRWGFANSTEQLSILSGEKFSDYLYVYARPATCLLPIKLFVELDSLGYYGDYFWKDPHTKSPDIKFEEMLSIGGVKGIACDLENASLIFTKNITDTNLFTPLFIQALSLNIAAKIAPSLTGDDKLATTMLSLYNGVISEAKRLNSTESNPSTAQTSSYQRARC